MYSAVQLQSNLICCKSLFLWEKVCSWQLVLCDFLLHALHQAQHRLPTHLNTSFLRYSNKYFSCHCIGGCCCLRPNPISCPHTTGFLHTTVSVSTGLIRCGCPVELTFSFVGGLVYRSTSVESLRLPVWIMQPFIDVSLVVDHDADIW